MAGWSLLSIPLAVLVASLLGSSHCISMCSPIAATLHGTRGYLSVYHFGRLLSYIVLGVLAGLVGEAVLSNNLPLVSKISAVLISVFFIFTGYRIIKKKTLDILPSKTMTSILLYPAKWSLTQNRATRSFVIGVVNGFLPCGWLYIFVIGSVASKDPFYSAFILFIFWLGTLPALTAFPMLYKKVFQNAPRKLSVAAGIVLILAGLLTITYHTLPHGSHGNGHSHMHMSTHE